MNIQMQLSRSFAAVVIVATFGSVLSPPVTAQGGIVPPLASPRIEPVQARLPTQRPEVTRITGIGRDACRRTSSILYEKPGTAASPETPQIELLGGRSGLRLVGPLMHEIERVELIVGTGRAQAARIFDPIGPDHATCSRIYGAGNGGISVELSLPDVTRQANARLRIFGHEQRITPTICRDSRGRVIPCPEQAERPPGRLMQEVALTIFPKPALVRVNPSSFSGRADPIGGRATFTGTGLSGMVRSDRDHNNRASVRTVSITDTQWVAELAATSFPPGSDRVVARFQPSVNLARNGQRQTMTFWDTALDGSNPIFSSVDVTFVRTGGGGARVGGGFRIVDDAPPNLLPQWLPSSQPLVHVIGTGRNNSRQVPQAFCAGVPQDQVGVVAVQPLVWGASVVNADVNVPVRVELRSGATVLSAFETTPPLRANANAQTRRNYPDRPTQIRVVNAVQARVSDFGRRGCFFDPALRANDPLGRVDPPNLCIVVDPDNRIDEGPAGERDNQLCIN